MFHYWDKKQLVKVIRVDDITNEDQSTLFSATSSAEEWKLQGDYFKKKKLWEPAMKCYQKADCPHLENEAKAYSLAQLAHNPGLKRTDINEIYLEAAHAFLKCDQSQHDYQCLVNAAKCLRNAKKYKESSQLYVLLGQNEKALKGYRRIKDAEGFAKIKEKMGDYDGAIRLLLKHDRLMDALKYATKYEDKISQCYNPHYLAIKYTDTLLKSEETSHHHAKHLEAAMEHLTLSERVNFYKTADMHEKACEVLKSEGKYKDLYRIYKAQGWYEEGIQISKSNRDRQDESIFILFKATAELSGETGSLEEGTKVQLKKRFEVDTEMGAKTALIYGNAIENHAMIKTAQRYYKKCHDSIGQIEAFNIAVARVEYDDEKRIKNIHLDKNEDFLSTTLAICKEIKHVTTYLSPFEEPSTAHKQIVSQLEHFYGFERRKVGDRLDDLYFIPPSSYPWTNELLESMKGDSEEIDSDGMLQLEVDSVLKGVCARFESYIEKWIVRDEIMLVKHFSESFSVHPPHQDVAISRYTYQTSYFRLLCNAFDLSQYGSTKFDSQGDLFEAVLNAITLYATGQMPSTSASLNVHSEFLTQKLNEEAMDVFTKKKVDFDKWLNAWRINCMSGKGSQKMSEILITLSQLCNKRAQEGAGDFPPVYVFDHRNQQYTHLFLLWLKSCELFRDGNTFISCNIVVYSVLRHIASEPSVWSTVSMSNLLNVITIFTTAILTMQASCCARFQHEGDVFIPHQYKTVSDVFFNMNGSLKMDFFRTCVQYVRFYKRDLFDFSSKLEKMLHCILKIVLGMHNVNFNPLKRALETEECLKNNEAHQYLTLVLVLFCNISWIKFNPDLLQKYRHYIYSCVKECKEPKLEEIYCKFLNSRTLLGCFGVTRELLEFSQDSLLQAHVFLDFRLNDIEIRFSPARYSKDLQKLQLTPFPIQLVPHQSKAVVMRSSLRADATPFVPSFGRLGMYQGYNQLTSSLLTSPTKTGSADIPPEFLTQDSAEADEDDPETSAALDFVPEHPSPAQLKLEKDAPLDYRFCSICACEVTTENESASSTSESIVSLYNHHTHTEAHITNSELFTQFDTEEKEYFSLAKLDLYKLLPQLNSLHIFRQDDKLQHTTESIESEIKDMEDNLLKIHNSGEWKTGITLLRDEYPGRIQLLQISAMRLMDETEKIKKEIEREAELQEKKDEEEMIEDELPDEVEDIVQSRADYGEKDKEKSRKRKKLRRIAQTSS